jgi:hypothetical protein
MRERLERKVKGKTIETQVFELRGFFAGGTLQGDSQEILKTVKPGEELT